MRQKNTQLPEWLVSIVHLPVTAFHFQYFKTFRLMVSFMFSSNSVASGCASSSLLQSFFFFAFFFRHTYHAFHLAHYSFTFCRICFAYYCQMQIHFAQLCDFFLNVIITGCPLFFHFLFQQQVHQIKHTAKRSSRVTYLTAG